MSPIYLPPFSRYLVGASSRTFVSGLNVESMVFDKRMTPMELEQMHTFSFREDEVEHLLNGTAPSPLPNYWEYRNSNLIEKVQDRAKYGGEGIIVEFTLGKMEVPGIDYEFFDASPLKFGFTPGIARVSNVYRLTDICPVMITPVEISHLAL